MSIAKHRARSWAWVTAAALLAMMQAPATADPMPPTDVMARPALAARSPARVALSSIARAANRLVAVGERGVIVLSDDSGRAWRQAPGPVSVTLTAVHFLSDNVGLAVGHSGVVLRTEDAGERWQLRLDGRSAAQLVLEAARRDPGDEKHMVTARQLVEDGPDKPFLAIHFNSSRQGYIVGAYGLIVRTDDAGATWQSWTAHVDNPQGLSFNAMAGGAAGLYIVGEQGAVWRASGDGSRFMRLETPYRGSFFSVAVTDDGQVIAAGLLGNVYRSADQGATWRKVELGTQVSIAAVLAGKGEELIIASQRGELFQQTSDGQGFVRVADAAPMALTDFIRAADGSLVGVGYRGVATLKSGSAR